MPRRTAKQAGARAPLLTRCAAALAALLAAGPSHADAPKADAPPPPVEARLWVIAPQAAAPWTMRIDNEGAVPLRVPADIRLLRFELEVPQPGKQRAKKVKCGAPSALRPGSFPDSRAVLLAPGESYVETFDPRLFCFGKDAAALAGGTVVRATLGWDPPPTWRKKAPEPPFAAETTDAPPSRSPLRQLVAPTMLLSFAAPPAPPKVAQVAAEAPAATATPPASATPPATPPADAPTAPVATAPIVDEGAPRLELSSVAMSDASSPRFASITVTAKNVGRRPMTAALRSRMIAFDIEGPDGRRSCAATPPSRAIPRDNYRTVKAGASVTFAVLLSEVCPIGTFTRPGLYRVTPTLHAGESGAELDLVAYTGVVAAPTATLLRLASAPDPFYAAPPAIVKTATLNPVDEETD